MRAATPTQPTAPITPAPTGPTTHKARLDVLAAAHGYARDACEGVFVCLVPGECYPRIHNATDEHQAYNQLREDTVDAYRDAWQAAEGWDLPAGWAMLQIC